MINVFVGIALLVAAISPPHPRPWVDVFLVVLALLSFWVAYLKYVSGSKT